MLQHRFGLEVGQVVGQQVVRVARIPRALHLSLVPVHGPGGSGQRVSLARSHLSAGQEVAPGTGRHRGGEGGGGPAPGVGEPRPVLVRGLVRVRVRVRAAGQGAGVRQVLERRELRGDDVALRPVGRHLGPHRWAVGKDVGGLGQRAQLAGGRVVEQLVGLEGGGVRLQSARVKLQTRGHHVHGVGGQPLGQRLGEGEGVGAHPRVQRVCHHPDVVAGQTQRLDLGQLLGLGLARHVLAQLVQSLVQPMHPVPLPRVGLDPSLLQLDHAGLGQLLLLGTPLLGRLAARAGLCPVLAFLAWPRPAPAGFPRLAASLLAVGVARWMMPGKVFAVAAGGGVRQVVGFRLVVVQVKAVVVVIVQHVEVV